MPMVLIIPTNNNSPLPCARKFHVDLLTINKVYDKWRGEGRGGLGMKKSSAM